MLAFFKKMEYYSRELQKQKEEIIMLDETIVKNRTKAILSELRHGNGYSEHVDLVVAGKDHPSVDLYSAYLGGANMFGENYVAEYREKYGAFRGVERHFIGNLQTNKAKYLVGKCDLIQSVGKMRLAQEISRLAVERELTQDVLIEVNLGERYKGGIPLAEVEELFPAFYNLEGLRVRGLMAMLPLTDDNDWKEYLVKVMRRKFVALRDKYEHISYLSMGMSEDYKMCVEYGSNMIRLGKAIFWGMPADKPEGGDKSGENGSGENKS